MRGSEKQLASKANFSHFFQLNCSNFGLFFKSFLLGLAKFSFWWGGGRGVAARWGIMLCGLGAFLMYRKS